MKTVSDFIHAIKSRQAEIAASLADGNAPEWSAYQRMVGHYAGLKESLAILNNLMDETDEDE